MLNYVSIIRPLNLVLIILMMLLVKFGLFEFLAIETALSTFSFGILILATLCIAAGGNVINDIYDVDIDLMNKPDATIIGKKVSEKWAHNFYLALTSLGVIAGFYVANEVDKPGLAAIFIAIAGLLYMYASQLKAKLLLGNLIISALVAMVLLIIILLDIFPVIVLEPSEGQITATSLLLHYALFAFYINFIREIVKDLQDINGDRKGNRNTIPIAIGRERTITLVFVLGVIAIIAILFYMYVYLYASKVVVLYFLMAIIAPLLIFVIKSWNASSIKDYGYLSVLLKIIMLLGVLSMYFQKFLVSTNA